MPTADEFFAPWESETASITDWPSMLGQINRVLTFVGRERTLAWRGLSNASYSLHSTLYRRLVSQSTRVDEADLIRFEERLLEVARSKWRFDDRGSLELFAQLQHLGGPTRLLDVTFNPLIALWFAVEPKFGPTGLPLTDIDGRLVAYDVSGRQVSLDADWGKRELPWRAPPAGWRDDLPRVWRPPSYNERIPAQDSAFLLGGVPGSANSRWYRKRPGDSTTNQLWGVEGARSVTSVPMRMYSLDSSRPYPASKPTLTIRIPGIAKATIRDVLDRSFGINTSSVYPDMYGLAQRGSFQVEM